MHTYMHTHIHAHTYIHSVTLSVEEHKWKKKLEKTQEYHLWILTLHRRHHHLHHRHSHHHPHHRHPHHHPHHHHRHRPHIVNILRVMSPHHAKVNHWKSPSSQWVKWNTTQSSALCIPQLKTHQNSRWQRSRPPPSHDSCVRGCLWAWYYRGMRRISD